MARLISRPDGLGLVSIEPLSGPRAVNAGQNQSISGFVQSVAGAFGLWRFRFAFHAMRGAEFRQYRKWITALHGGANATRWPFCDPDAITFQEAGVDASNFEIATGQPWSNGEPWSNDQNWATSRPNIAVAEDAAKDATIVKLADSFWGHQLDGGDYLGFFPFHFGLYLVTEVISAGTYRIWPPLRKAITTDDFATLNPTLALRLEGEDAASAGRGLVVADTLQITMIEVLDYDVRKYFAD
ncbi:hypothetical protein [Nitratireductor rhodophyticola]|uniref:hypothetical protein n=1 Tax=Nitratireductor rhodophyticola TaxID=2854036 RepID=UPI003BA9712D